MNKKLPTQTALLSALLLEITGSAQAAIIQVDLTNCNLADAITAVNTDTATGGCSAGSGADVLELSSPNDQFVLTTALPTIASDVTINGNGVEVARNYNAADFTVLTIDPGVAVEINDLTITGGRLADNYGAGVFADNAATVVINNSIISGNEGGGVFFFNNIGSEINDSVIENNTANATYYYGAGVTVLGGDVAINNTTIAGNNSAATEAGGGGVYVSDFLDPTTLNITNSTLSGNSSENPGGGIGSFGFGNYGLELNLNNVTLVQNSSESGGGGLYTLNTDIAITQSLVSGNVAVSGNQWLSAGTTYATIDAYNVFGENNDSGVSGVTLGASDVVPSESPPQIFNLSLADNGGPTPTHALVPNGPAVDVVPAGSCLLVSDQTGQSRPQDGDGDGTADCDVGSVESVSDLIFKNGFD